LWAVNKQKSKEGVNDFGIWHLWFFFNLKWVFMH